MELDKKVHHVCEENEYLKRRLMEFEMEASRANKEIEALKSEMELQATNCKEREETKDAKLFAIIARLREEFERKETDFLKQIGELTFNKEQTIERLEWSRQEIERLTSNCGKRELEVEELMSQKEELKNEFEEKECAISNAEEEIMQLRKRFENIRIPVFF